MSCFTHRESGVLKFGIPLVVVFLLIIQYPYAAEWENPGRFRNGKMRLDMQSYMLTLSFDCKKSNPTRYVEYIIILKHRQGAFRICIEMYRSWVPQVRYSSLKMAALPLVSMASGITPRNDPRNDAKSNAMEDRSWSSGRSCGYIFVRKPMFILNHVTNWLF